MKENIDMWESDDLWINKGKCSHIRWQKYWTEHPRKRNMNEKYKIRNSISLIIKEIFIKLKISYYFPLNRNSNIYANIRFWSWQKHNNTNIN
jgi:hypothetical protein